MGTIVQDIRVAMRMLLKNPGFSVVVVLTLALGIGANTAVFSIVNSFLFSPLPVKDPGRLIVMAYEDPKASFPHEVSNADLQDFQAHSEVTSDMTAFLVNFAGLSAGNRSERVFVTFAKGKYFSTLGIQPALGRLFLPSEGETAGADPVIVLGYAYWTRRFNGDPSVVGKSVNLNGQPVTIIGVTPKPFFGTFYIVDSDAYEPLGMFASSAGSVDILTDRTQRQLRVLAHLKPGVSMAQASASLQVIADNLARAYPQTDAGLKMDLIPEKLARPEAASASFWPVIASVLMGLVMVVTCVNVTNLLLARASMRAKEMAVRAALGAGRVRLFRQLLTESLLLSGLGALGGAFIGMWLMKWIETLQLPGDMAIRTTQPFDWRMFMFVCSLAVASGLLAVVGMYGVISYAVNQRVHEIAVRIALGAQKQNIFGMVIGYGLKLVVAGLVIGVALAAGLSRFLESLLVNTGALDPIAYLSASSVLVAVAALGCYIPARRAVRVDPMVTLHYE